MLSGISHLISFHDFYDHIQDPTHVMVGGLEVLGRAKTCHCPEANSIPISNNTCSTGLQSTKACSDSWKMIVAGRTLIEGMFTLLPVVGRLTLATASKYYVLV